MNISSHDLERLRLAALVFGQTLSLTPDQTRDLNLLIVDLADAGEAKEAIAVQILRFLSN